MRTLIALLLASIFAQAPAATLRIVVVEGEGAVNIIQQKTAVRPLVEVRDRNNVPVSGATVTFTLNGQPAAFANGATTMSVTTNAQGQAAAAGFNAVRPGAVQIQVSAAHQGQTAATTISQTNFATAAAASAAGVATGAAASGGAATGAGGATAAAGTTGAAVGGGISATTIAIVGAAVGGGAVVATQVAKSDGGDEFDPYEGTFSGQMVFSISRVGPPCTVTRAISGSLKIDLRTDNSGGAVALMGAGQLISAIGCTDSQITEFSVADTQASGGPGALTFSSSRTTTTPLGENTNRITFTGSHSGSTITGSLTIESSIRYTDASPGTGSGTVTVPVTLTRTAGR